MFLTVWARPLCLTRLSAATACLLEHVGQPTGLWGCLQGLRTTLACSLGAACSSLHCNAWECGVGAPEGHGALAHVQPA